MEKKKIGIIASRLMFADSVCVNSQKWIDKFLEMGFDVHLLYGKIGVKSNLPKFELAEMDYKHSEIRAIKRMAFDSNLDKAGIKAFDILLNNLISRIKKPLRKYIEDNKIDYLCVEDILGGGKNLPLILTLNKIISDLKIPTIGKHYKLFWDINYFTKNLNIPKILNQLPSNSKKITHITSNSIAQKSLVEKRNISSMMIPHLINLKAMQELDEFNKEFRKEFGINNDQILILQPTKISRTKGVEKSIKLLQEINKATKKDNVLMITGHPVYHRGNYFEEIVKRINKADVNVIFANEKISLKRQQNGDEKIFSIWDAYIHADIISFPTTGVGFGNPVIESMTYKKPLIVTKFENLQSFIDKGAQFVVVDQSINQDSVSDICELIFDKKKRKQVVENNFKIIKDSYDVDILDEKITSIIKSYETESLFRWMTRQARRVGRYVPHPEKLIPEFIKGRPRYRAKQNNRNNNANHKQDSTKLLANPKGTAQQNKKPKGVSEHDILGEYDKLTEAEFSGKKDSSKDFSDKKQDRRNNISKKPVYKKKLGKKTGPQ